MQKKILVFDTGRGGEAFAEFFRAKYPDWLVETAIDTAHAPYGPKTDAEILQLVDTILTPYVGKFDVIVLACNTATAVAIDKLREKYPSQVFIGFEPMIKSASKITETGKIIVFATAATKRSNRYQNLKARFPELQILEPDCGAWASKIDQGTFNEADVRTALHHITGADVIVLGCTHYVTQKDLIQAVAGSSVKVIDPFARIADYIVKILFAQQHNKKSAK